MRPQTRRLQRDWREGIAGSRGLTLAVARPLATLFGGRDERSSRSRAKAQRSSRPIQPSKEFLMQSFHDFEMSSITGESVKLSRYDGQVCLVVNLASE